MTDDTIVRLEALLDATGGGRAAAGRAGTPTLGTYVDDHPEHGAELAARLDAAREQTAAVPTAYLEAANSVTRELMSAAALSRAVDAAPEAAHRATSELERYLREIEHSGAGP